MIKCERVRFPKGDASLTRLVKKLSEERGVEIEVHETWNGYGYAVTSYTADAGVVEEARRIVAERRLAETAKEEERRLVETAEEEERERRREEERLRAWAEEVAHLYPRLEPIPPWGTRLYSRWDAVPIHLYSRTQWRRIGFEVRSDALATGLCCLHKGRVVVPLFGGHQVEPRRSRHAHLSGEALWDRYRAMGLGLAHAVWAANKLQKIRPHEKAAFYRLKDRFLEASQAHLIEGRVARHEVRECWDCEGEFEDCWKCGGTGIYSERTLYEHLLEVDGRAWSFHSYVRPRIVGDTPGADLSVYGKRFGPTDKVPFRLAEYIKMLAYVLEQRA